MSSFLDSSRPDVGPGAGQSPFSPNSPVESAAVRHLRNHSKYLIEGSRVGTPARDRSGHLRNLCESLDRVPIYCCSCQPDGRVQESSDPSCAQFLASDRIIVTHDGDSPCHVVTRTRSGSGAEPQPIRTEVGVVPRVLRDRDSGLATGGLCCMRVRPAAGFIRGAPVAYQCSPRIADRVKPLLVPVLNGVLVVVTQKFPRVSRWLLELLWISGPLALLAFFVSLTQFLVQTQAAAGRDVSWLQIPVRVGTAVVPWWIIFAIDIAVIVYGYVFLNINLTSLHGFYRDRLASAYLLKPADLPVLRARRPTRSSSSRIWELPHARPIIW